MDPSTTKTFHSKVYPAISPHRPILSASGRTVFITGGGAGVGATITRSFATAGALDIAIIGRRPVPLLDTKTTLEKEFPGLRIFTRVADVLDRPSIDSALTDFSTHVGGRSIDVLIHNVGYLSHIAMIKDAQISEWWKGFEINILGSLNVAQAFIPYAASNANVVYVTTAVATAAPLPGGSAYAASKLGATKVFEYFQAENPALKVVSVHPGVLQTEMQDKLIEDGIRMPQDESESFCYFNLSVV